jgi:hypothetical protein
MSNQHSQLNGKTFLDLTDSEKRQVLQFEFVTTVVYGATTDQIRELFRRLQLGVRLNPAEIRNSMASAIGNAVRAMALTHPFFINGAFSTARYKVDDLLAHAFAIVIYERQRDIKAPDLRAMYIEYSRKVDSGFAKKVNEILHFLDEVQKERPRCIKTKWGFVDLVGVLAKRNLKKLDPGSVADAYVGWEEDRAKMIGRLPELAAARAGSRNRMLFEYIGAFQKEGATKKNLETRFRVLNSILLSS